MTPASASIVSLSSRLLLRATALVAAVIALGCTPKYVTNVPVEACPSQPAPQRSIRVDGIATVQVSPDVVDLTMTLTSEAERPQPAVAAVRGQRDALVAALQAAKIPRANLHLGHVDVSPRYRAQPEQHIIDGYQAAITLVATLTELDRIGEIMELGATFGVTRMHSRFRSTKMPEFKMQARELALAAARAKAAQMARYMNVVIGAVISLEEVAPQTPQFGLENNVAVMAPTTGDGPGLQPGSLPLTLSVQVTYALTESHPGYAPYAPSRP